MEETKMSVKAYLEITMKIDEAKRPAAANVYTEYRGSFLDTIPHTSQAICSKTMCSSGFSPFGTPIPM